MLIIDSLAQFVLLLNITKQSLITRDRKRSLSPFCRQSLTGHSFVSLALPRNTLVSQYCPAHVSSYNPPYTPPLPPICLQSNPQLPTRQSSPKPFHHLHCTFRVVTLGPRLPYQMTTTVTLYSIIAWGFISSDSRSSYCFILKQRKTLAQLIPILGYAALCFGDWIGIPSIHVHNYVYVWVTGSSCVYSGPWEERHHGNHQTWPSTVTSGWSGQYPHLSKHGLARKWFGVLKWDQTLSPTTVHI